MSERADIELSSIRQVMKNKSKKVNEILSTGSWDIDNSIFRYLVYLQTQSGGIKPRLYELLFARLIGSVLLFLINLA